MMEGIPRLETPFLHLSFSCPVQMHYVSSPLEAVDEHNIRLGACLNLKENK